MHELAEAGTECQADHRKQRWRREDKQEGNPATQAPTMPVGEIADDRAKNHEDELRQGADEQGRQGIRRLELFELELNDGRNGSFFELPRKIPPKQPGK